MEETYISNYILALAIGTVGFGLSLILYIPNRKQNYPSRLLAGFLFCLTLTGINHILLVTDFYIFHPHLWRVLVFTSILHPSLSYLYVRNILEQQIRMRKWDWLYALPAIVYTASYLPFYMKNADEKKIIIVNTLSKPINYSLEPEGILPPGIGVGLRLTFGIAMVIGQIILIWRWKKMIRNTTNINKQNKEIINWLYFLSGILLFTYMIYSIISSFQVLGFSDLFLGLAIIVFIAIASIGIYLFLKPHILYGLMGWFQAEILIPVDISVKNERINLLLDRTTISSAQKKEIKNKIELHFLNNKHYTQPGYRISDLSNSVNTPIYLLAGFINQEYGLNFNEFINNYRIEHFTEVIRKNKEFKPDELIELKKLSGFESDSEFKIAIKKKTGMNWLEYFEEYRAKR